MKMKKKFSDTLSMEHAENYHNVAEITCLQLSFRALDFAHIHRDEFSTHLNFVYTLEKALNDL